MRKFDYRVYLSLMDSKSGLQKIGTIEAYKVVENILNGIFERGAIFEEERINRCNPERVVIEKVLRIELFNTDMAKVDRFVDILKLAFNQESVFVEEIEEAFDIV